MHLHWLMWEGHKRIQDCWNVLTPSVQLFKDMKTNVYIFTTIIHIFFYASKNSVVIYNNLLASKKYNLHLLALFRQWRPEESYQSHCLPFHCGPTPCHCMIYCSDKVIPYLVMSLLITPLLIYPISVCRLHLVWVCGLVCILHRSSAKPCWSLTVSYLWEQLGMVIIVHSHSPIVDLRAIYWDGTHSCLEICMN